MDDWCVSAFKTESMKEWVRLKQMTVLETQRLRNWGRYAKEQENFFGPEECFFLAIPFNG